MHITVIKLVFHGQLNEYEISTAQKNLNAEKFLLLSNSHMLDLSCF